MIFLIKRCIIVAYRVVFYPHINDLKPASVTQKMPKPKSPERPPKRKVEPKVAAKAVPRKVSPKSAHAPGGEVRSLARPPIPFSENCYDEVEQLSADIEDELDDVPVPDEKEMVHPTAPPCGQYPTLIRELLSICVGEVSDVRGAFRNRNRQKYKNIFDSYKDKLSQRDYSIAKSALFYIYDFSRVNSIDKATALWMLGIYEIPTSQIISYTSKEVLKSISKDHGLSYSNKKAEELVENIRGVIDPSV
jgi:hypothetical protein